MEYVLVVHPAEEGGYWAEVPALAGCFIQGDTLEVVLEQAPTAIVSHIEALREDGQAVPESNAIIIAAVTAPAGSRPGDAHAATTLLTDEAEGGPEAPDTATLPF